LRSITPRPRSATPRSSPMQGSNASVTCPTCSATRTPLPGSRRVAHEHWLRQRRPPVLTVDARRRIQGETIRLPVRITDAEMSAAVFIASARRGDGLSGGDWFAAPPTVEDRISGIRSSTVGTVRLPASARWISSTPSEIAPSMSGNAKPPEFPRCWRWVRTPHPPRHHALPRTPRSPTRRTSRKPVRGTRHTAV
jgi:hypothetical protein